MPINISNQKPAVLYDQPFNILPNIDPSVDEISYRDALNKHFDDKYVDPVFVPINAAHPVLITDNNQTIDKDTLSNAASHLWQSSVLDVTLQEQLGEIYRQTIQYHAPNNWMFDEQLGVEALTRNKLPLPTAPGSKRTVSYTAGIDIIPTAKGYLAQPDDMHAGEWFANLTAYTHNQEYKNYLVVTMQSNQVFDDFKQTFNNFINVWHGQTTMTTDVTQTISDFNKVSLQQDLSSTIFLPNKGGMNPVEHQPYAFTRMLMYALSEYEKQYQTGEITVHPANLKQVYYPENIVFINLENYAHAVASDIKKDWDDIQDALRIKKAINYVSNKKLMTAKKMKRSTAGDASSTMASKGADIAQSALQPFSGMPVSSKSTMMAMANIIMSQMTSKQTENTYKTHKSSYMRANRRDPDNINLAGKLTTTKYRPDIHIYLDTSGSISEDQYRDAIINLIKLTKKIDSNLYFTSFSHFVSQTVLIKTKERSLKEIYKEFRLTPKASGGTDFENVWTKIDLIDNHNEKTNKSYQINFVITDFGYSISSDKRFDVTNASSKHTYYVPISTDKQTWQSVKHYAENLTKQVIKAGDTQFRKRILM